MRVLVTGMQIVIYHIPRRSLRGPFSINRDTAYVDHRRLRRQHRKWKERFK